MSDKTTPWPDRRYAAEIDILIGMEQVLIHPDKIAISNNLAVYKSHLSPTPILGGRHEKIVV